MSSFRQAVMRGPSFTGAGYRPDLTPAHQVDLLTGIGPRGAKMSLRRKSAGRGFDASVNEASLLDNGGDYRTSEQRVGRTG